MPKPMTIIDELWCIYHVLLRQNKFFLCSNSSIRSNTQSWNYEFWIFSRKWMGLFSNIWKLAFLVKINQRVNFENLFWANQNKQQNSGSVDLGLGVSFDEGNNQLVFKAFHAQIFPLHHHCHLVHFVKVIY